MVNTILKLIKFNNFVNYLAAGTLENFEFYINKIRNAGYEEEADFVSSLVFDRVNKIAGVV